MADTTELPPEQQPENPHSARAAQNADGAENPTGATERIEPVTIVEEAPKKKSRLPKVILIVLAVLLVLAAAYVVVDNWARGQISSLVSERVAEVLTTNNEVTTEVGGFSVLAQLATGRLENVKIAADEVRLGELIGDVRVTATGVPVDIQNQPVEQVDARLVVTEENLAKIAGELTAGTIDSFELVAGEVQVGTAVEILGFKLTLGLGLEVEAVDGDLVFTPTSVELAGTRTSADDLVQQFGGLARELVAPKPLCVAQWLPAALTITDVAVDGTDLVVDIDAENVILDTATLDTKGTC